MSRAEPTKLKTLFEPSARTVPEMLRRQAARYGDHALFVCAAPFTAPRYAVAVVVEHGQSGAKAAAPIARDIMCRALEIDPAGEARRSVRPAGTGV